MSEITPRERFLRLLSYQPVDRLPVMSVEDYYEEPALARWRAEGLPADVHPEAALGMDSKRHVPVDFSPRPAFEIRRIAEDEEYIVETDWIGTTVRRRKDAPSMYYGHIDFPVKSLADWRRFAERFRPDPARVPQPFAETAVALDAATTPVGLILYPFFFRLGFYGLGMERFMLAVHDEPELLHEMFSYWSDFVLKVIRPLLGRVRIDFVAIAEDLAYKGGPHFSPAIYREFWLPYQNPIVEELRRAGIPIIGLWSSGNLNVLIPLLLENGVNAVMPVEQIADMDPIALRRRYGRELRLLGGFPKEALIAGPAAIDAELTRLRPLIAEGGYLPTLDDVVPPEVPWEVYRYFIARLRQLRF